MRLWRWGCFTLVVLSIVVYAASLGDTTIWEDDRLIRSGRGTLAETFTNPFLGNYFRPLVTLSFWLDHRLWHEEPFMYHQTNILIHALTTLVLVLLLRRSFRSRAVALAGGLLFAIQPAQVSAVAWIGGRTDSLATLLVALFAWTLIEGIRSLHQHNLWIGASVFCYLLALLAKEQVIALFPLVPLAFHCFAPDEKPDSRKLAWRAAVSFATVIAIFVIFAFRFGPGLPSSASHTLLYKLGLGGRTITYYALLLAAPSMRWMHTLTVMSLARAGTVTVVIGYGFVVAGLWLFLRWLRSAPAAAWFLGLSVLAILPVSNIIPVGSLIVAPFRAGIAGIGVAAVMGWGVVALLRLHNGRERSSATIPSAAALRTVGAVATAAFACWCIWLTVWGAAQWSDEERLLNTFARFDPACNYVREANASVLMKSGKGRRAERNAAEYLAFVFGSDAWRTPAGAAKALDTDTQVIARTHSSNGDKRNPRTALADMSVILGYARWMQGDRQGAEVAFRTGEAIEPDNASVSMAFGRLFTDEKRWGQAIPYLQSIIRRNPRVFLADLLLGRCFAELGQYHEAVSAYRAAVPLQPWDGSPYIALADVQLKAGDRMGAIRTLDDGRRLALTGTELIATKLSQLRNETALPARGNR